MSVVHVAAATDAAYVPWTAAALLSCIESSGADDIHVHLFLANDVAEQDRNDLRELMATRGALAKLLPVDDAALARLPAKTAAGGGRICWVRTLLPDRLPDIDRVIYLDADVFVRAPIGDLWRIDLQGAPIAAVPNVVHPGMHAHVASMGVTGSAGYFNAGVIIVDLELWREQHLASSVMDYAVGHPNNPWFDQDALNVVFNGRWHRLHPRWNAMNSLWTWPEWANRVYGDEALDARDDPAILHFEGPALCKPWHYLSNHPFRDSYWDTVRRTPWGSATLEGRTVANWLIARLPRERWEAAYLQAQRARTRGRRLTGR
ncbi:MAG: hypothetical protein QOI95_3465 [Acidimicrobiaceae bacterium]|jgi:lipopolysaccharide biosynthesis glycosyltransferase